MDKETIKEWAGEIISFRKIYSDSIRIIRIRWANTML